jgi:signal peptidase I
MVKSRRIWLAALLNLVAPGLGQLYNGQPVKGFVIPGTILALSLASAFAVHTSFAWVRYLSTVVSVAAILDAALAARRQKDYVLRAYNRPASYIGFVVLWGALSFAASALSHRFIAQPAKIPSRAMEPTLRPGDVVLVKKFNIDLKRGDIVTFVMPPAGRVNASESEKGKVILKRIVALPGETVQIVNKRLSVNGQWVDEPFAIYEDKMIYKADPQLRGDTYQTRWESGDFARLQRSQVGDNFGPVKLHPNAYFVLGDNRDGSFDSRFFGPVPATAVTGKVSLIVSPKDRARKFQGGVR